MSGLLRDLLLAIAVMTAILWVAGKFTQAAPEPVPHVVSWRV